MVPNINHKLSSFRMRGQSESKLLNSSSNHKLKDVFLENITVLNAKLEIPRK